ncbi:hypothetical protein C7M84_024439 [Penaeus vannamei]|uniref:Uncharacterized protein n=1 Tax=Penaeus vannamei TaxID=6689 RepID=A0A3R7QXU0_PENVA|nr:hypothetical protein C7M84_024439 [Penaeus vannamei]
MGEFVEFERDRNGGEEYKKCHRNAFPTEPLRPPSLKVQSVTDFLPAQSRPIMNLLHLLVVVIAAMIGSSHALPEPDPMAEAGHDLVVRGYVQPPRFHYRGFHRPYPKYDWE